MSRLTTLTSRQEKLKLNPPFIVTMNNTTSNIDISSNLTTNLSISSNLIINTVQNGKSIIYLGTQNSTTSALKTAIIAEGMNDWSRAKLHFCLNNMGDRGAGVLPDGNNTIYNASIADARMTILYDGNVGIGKTNPAYKLHVTAGKTVASTAFAMKISGGEFLNIGNHGTLIGLGSEDGSFTKCAIGHVRNDSDDRGDIVFLATNNTGSGSCSMSDEKMRISKFGFVGIGNTNPVSLLSLNATPRSADTFNWGNCPMTITHPTITGATASTLNDPKPILHLCRDGTVNTNYAERATFNLCRYEHPISNPTTGSRTRLDIGLTHTTFDDEICVMSLRSDGNVGIGKTNPNCRLYISANLAASATVYAMRLSCGTSTDAGGFGTLLGLGSEPNGWSKCAIGHTRTANYDQGDIVFLSRATADNADCTMSDEKMRIKSNGNVGIGTTNPGNILQVGANGRLRIANDTADFTLIGTKDVEDNNNTKIVLSGYTRGSPHAGNIDYVSTAGFHRFYTNGSTERMRIANDGTITTSNIDCIGGIAITAANAFYQTTSVDPGNLSQTYITFKEAGANSDWCYLRQIGGTNEYKLALDIHDDGTEARFCIRSIASVNATDTITEVFAVDNGNVKATGTVRATGFTAVNGEYELMIAPPTATAAATIQTIQQNTGFNQNLTLQAVTNSGNIGIGITNPVCKLEIKGAVGINNGSSFAIANNKMQAGSLTIGDQTLNYGGGIDWTANTAGLMFECLDNTEIAVHDSGNRVSSLMYFQGGATNSITIGRNFSPWGAISSVVLNGNVGIGTNNPTNILQVGDGARLRIANDANDYSLIGTKTGDDTTNTRIVISGNNRGSSLSGCIEYLASTDTGDHIFKTSGQNEKMRIAKNGLVTISGDLTTSGTLSFGSRTPDFLIYLYGTDYGFGINDSTLRYNSGGSHKFYTGATNTATISNTGTITATAFSGPLTGNVTGNCSGSAASLTSGDKTISGTLTATAFSGPLTGNVTGNCSGSSSSCTGAAASLTSGNKTISGTLTATAFSGPLTGNVTGNCSGSSSSCTGAAASLTSGNKTISGQLNCNTLEINNPNGSITHLPYSDNQNYIRGNTIISGIVGITNNTPVGTLHIGITASLSDTSLYISANNSGNRTCRMGYNGGWSFCIGDIGPNDSGTWNPQFLINYAAPANILYFNENGRLHANQFWNVSDERLKSNIQTIDNALLKVQELRGVTFTFISDNTRDIGLIAQEVEYIIPEAVKENELNNTKGINYSGLVGLLVQAIKELNNKVIKLENILINNNLN
jgi:hypothetical protein